MKTLIVEDNKTSGKLLQAVLEAEGFETALADDGQEALHALEKHDVDCIVSDVMMPNVDGYRLVYSVRKNAKYKDIPFIMYTSFYGSEDDEQFAASLGVNKYIRKTGTAKDIVAAIRELIESRNHPTKQDDKMTPRDQWVMEKYGKLLIDKLEVKVDELEKTKRELEWNEKKLVEAYETINSKKTMLVQERERIMQLNHSLSDFQHAISECSIVSRADKKGCISFVNKNLVAISGYSEEELLGQNHRILNSGFHPKSFWANMWKTISSGQPWRGDVKNKAKDGTFYWVDAFIIPFLDQEGKVIEFLSIRNEITKRKLAEEMLSQTNDVLTEYKQNLEKKVEDRTRELNEALKKEKELVSLKSQFISITSHEFKTPLASIHFQTGMLKRYRAKFSEKDISQRLESIEHQVTLMIDLLDDVVLMGSVECVKMKTHIKKFDGHDFFDLVIAEVLDSSGHSHAINPYVHLLHNEIETDKKLLHQIVSNLLCNAVKYSPKAKPIGLTVLEQNDNLVIEVKDYGRGIDEEDQRTIFEAFTRGKNIENVPGTGLGLSIVKKSVDLLQGMVSVKSKLDEGSTFTVTIPLKKNEMTIKPGFVEESA